MYHGYNFKTLPQGAVVSLLRLSPTVEVCANALEQRANTFLSDSSLWHGGGAKEKQQDSSQPYKPSSIYVPACSNEATWWCSFMKPHRQARGL